MLQKRIQKLIASDLEISSTNDLLSDLIPAQQRSSLTSDSVEAHFQVRDAFEDLVSARLASICAALTPLECQFAEISALTETADEATIRVQSQLGVKTGNFRSSDIFDLEISLAVAEKFRGLFEVGEEQSVVEKIPRVSQVIGNCTLPDSSCATRPWKSRRSEISMQNVLPFPSIRTSRSSRPEALNRKFVIGVFIDLEISSTSASSIDVSGFTSLAANHLDCEIFRENFRYFPITNTPSRCTRTEISRKFVVDISRFTAGSSGDDGVDGAGSRRRSRVFNASFTENIR